MNEITTTDFAKFGYRERKMAEELLRAWNDNGLPENFDDEGVTIMMNMNSGNVFLTNENCDVAMMNGDELESWYFCPYCGHEGFAEDMQHEPEDRDCTDYMRSIGVIADEDEAEEEETA